MIESFLIGLAILLLLLLCFALSICIKTKKEKNEEIKWAELLKDCCNTDLKKVYAG